MLVISTAALGLLIITRIWICQLSHHVPYMGVNSMTTRLGKAKLFN